MRISSASKLSFDLLLIAVGIMAVSISGGHGIFGLDGNAKPSSRLRIERERCFEEGRRQLGILIASIEAYKRTFGFYPPDHVIGHSPIVVDPVTNQLLYELTGTYFDCARDAFATSKQFSVPLCKIEEYFGVERFENVADSPQEVRRFLNQSDITIARINTRPERIGLIAFWPTWEGVDNNLYSHTPVASWRYNSSCPAHNKLGFDLWLELTTSTTNVLIKNW